MNEGGGCSSRKSNSSTSSSSSLSPPTTTASFSFLLHRFCGGVNMFFSPKNYDYDSAGVEKKKKKRTLTLAPGRPPQMLLVTSANSGEEFERVFRHLDEDGDGKISPSELRSCMRTVVGEELSPEDAEAVVESNDSDGDGLLGFEDFVKLVEVEGEEERTRNLRQAFGMYEMEGEGCITPNSLGRMLGKLGESKTIDECEVMIRRFDINGDGVLSFEEFLIMML